ncbi:hypothetical protein [Hufsiella ginkgonis]|uniref:AAA family ATPase n=1 Tax=Hufsiella ginkgonis TaxID=2695274 RepID=A0A7K1XUD1_9SPHI|nr:hypothetical protein [Hufsiella ginkgonis]MXV14407.1 hypothetical protein [Hufsiella ginkgonis]
MAKFQDDEAFYIGWEDVVKDLRAMPGFTENDVTGLIIERYGSATGNPFNSKKAIVDFLTRVSPGDLIIACKGRREILGIGITDGGIQYNEEEDEYYGYRNVDWLLKTTPENNKSPFTLAVKTITPLASPYAIQVLKGLLGETLEVKGHPFPETKEETNLPLNQILYGPPGTGKTYCTINKALEIINPLGYQKLTEAGTDEETTRIELKRLYTRYIDDGRISFCTFHQSMSYEDFVEGIKPITEEDDDGRKTIGYEIADGIFKQVSVLASYKLLTAAQPTKQDLASSKDGNLRNGGMHCLFTLKSY